MSKTFDRPIIIQKFNELSEDWEDAYKVHASINKAKANNEYLNGGAIQNKRTLIFEIRYFVGLEDVSYNLQSYRVLYMGVPFNLTDYDDFMLQHKTVKLEGASY